MPDGKFTSARGGLALSLILTVVRLSGASRYEQSPVCWHCVADPSAVIKGEAPQIQALSNFHAGVPNRVSRGIMVGQPIERSHPTPLTPPADILSYTRDTFGAAGAGGTAISKLVVYAPFAATCSVCPKT